MASKPLESGHLKSISGQRPKPRPRKELNLERYRERRDEALAVIWLASWLGETEPRHDAVVPRVPSG
jgi:hypothetical protein